MKSSSWGDGQDQDQWTWLPRFLCQQFWAREDAEVGKAVPFCLSFSDNLAFMGLSAFPEPGTLW